MAGAALLQGQTPLRGPASKRGVWVWLWPQRGWNSLEPSACASQLVSLGCVGVIPQSGLGTMQWLTAERVAQFRNAGLDVCAGFGMDGTHLPVQYVQAFIEGLDIAGSIMGDWESSSLWENAAGHALAQSIVNGVLRQRPDAPSRSVDCPWWAPTSTPQGGGTHPQAPTRIFSGLFQRRFVQAYGAGLDGRSTEMLAHARRQYPALGTLAKNVFPSYQGYGRSVNDVVQSIIAEPIVCLWDFSEFDSATYTGLRAVKALRGAGYDGVGAVKAFQVAHGISADNIVGEQTLSALGGVSQ